jgi:hypothetical protein
MGLKNLGCAQRKRRHLHGDVAAIGFCQPAMVSDMTAASVGGVQLAQATGNTYLHGRRAWL